MRHVALARSSDRRRADCRVLTIWRRGVEPQICARGNASQSAGRKASGDLMMARRAKVSRELVTLDSHWICGVPGMQLDLACALRSTDEPYPSHRRERRGLPH
eukprot:scaffold1833_cov255-Pinguiococcus_pyrenoidosus.AAC.17